MTLNEFLNTSILSFLYFLVVLAFSKKSNTPKGYRTLSAVFLVFSLVFANELLEKTTAYKNFPILTIVFEPVLYAIAPIIYLAVIHLTTVDKKISLRILTHFIPYLLLLSLYIILYQHQTASKSSFNNEATNNEDLLQGILLFIFFVQISIYLYLSTRHLKSYKQKLPLYVSNISANDFHWLYKTIIGLALISGISFIEVLFNQMNVSQYFSILYLIGFYYIGIQLSKQNEVFPFSSEQQKGIHDVIKDQMLFNNSDINIEKKSAEFVDSKINKSISENGTTESLVRKKVISEEKIREYKKQLLDLMRGDKPYLDSEITLPKLGQMMQLNTYQISYLINKCFNENFYTFINRYRLEECKQMLLDKENSHLKILDIAFENGFNSKTAFNSSFKRDTGLSPKEFIKQNTKSNQ